MQKYLSFPYFYIIAWIIFSLTPYVYHSTKLITALLYFFVGTALYYSVYAAANFKLPAYFRTTFAFVFFLSVYGIGLIVLGDDVYIQFIGSYIKKENYFIWLIISLLTSVPIYVFTCRGQIDEKGMKKIFFVMLATSIYAFYGSIKIQLQLAEINGVMQEDFTITCVYALLSIIPLLVIFENNVFLQIVLLGISSVYLILSAKRGAIILGSCCVVVLVWNVIYHSPVKKKLLVLLIALAFVVGVYEFVLYQLNTNPYFVYRVNQTLEGYTSGRDVYSRNVLNYFETVPIKSFLFGIGAQGTLGVNESFAHNDWLAILLEQGLVGFVMYLFYWLGFFYSWVKSRCVSECFVAIGLLFVIGLGKTFFSMYYLPVSLEMIMSSGFFAIVLGYFLAKAFPQELLQTKNE